MAARKPVMNIVEWRGVKLRHQVAASDFDGGFHAWVADHLAGRPFVAVTLEVFNLHWTDVRWSADLRLDAAFLNDEDEAHSAFDCEAAEASALEAFEEAREAAYWERLISDAEEARR